MKTKAKTKTKKGKGAPACLKMPVAKLIEHLQKRVRVAEERVALLEGAIYTHRRDVWGWDADVKEIDHAQDRELYRVLKSKGERK